MALKASHIADMLKNNSRKPGSADPLPCDRQTCGLAARRAFPDTADTGTGPARKEASA